MTKQAFIIPLLLAAFILPQLGCNAPRPAAKDRLKVAVTILPLQEFVESIGGDKVNVTVMVPPGAEPHGFEPKPRQLEEIAGSRIYVKVGSGLEFEKIWIDKFLKINKEMKVCDASSGIRLLDSDPHIWPSLRNAEIMVNNIKKALQKADPDNKDFYERNSNAYIKDLRSIDFTNRQVLKKLKRRAFIVFHPEWAYFARDYGLEQKAIETGGKEPKAGDLESLIKFARKNGIRVIFVSPQFSRKAASVIAGQINGTVVSVDPLSKDYASNMANVAWELLRALK